MECGRETFGVLTATPSRIEEGGEAKGRKGFVIETISGRLGALESQVNE
jgi:hypothetical protein